MFGLLVRSLRPSGDPEFCFGDIDLLIGENDLLIGDTEFVGDLALEPPPEADFLTFRLFRFDEESDDVSVAFAIALLIDFSLLLDADTSSSSLLLRRTLPLVFLATALPLLLR